MWFYIDDCGNFERVGTEAEAISGAEAALERCRELAADDGWPDETGGICWGAIRQRAEERDTHEHGDDCEDEDGTGSCAEGFSMYHDSFVDYVLADVEVAK